MQTLKPQNIFNTIHQLPLVELTLLIKRKIMIFQKVQLDYNACIDQKVCSH